MSARRVLVSCAVLSVQDSCVFYPCCANCFCRIDVEPRDPSRYRCSRCGDSCPRAKVEYRYRLMLTVIRDKCIFKVTVFGACLNPFFGITATGLQRLVENSDGPVEASTKNPLLVKAVKDFFIGRHFIFGIKVPGTMGQLSFSGPGLDKDGNRVHFVASQMLVLGAAGLGGCTVISYYKSLLQRDTENEPESKTTSDPHAPMLLTHQLSPTSNFNRTTLFNSSLVILSPPRSQHEDSTLTPTPPWQQSLGLITSSAEQEEVCTSTQDERNDKSHQKTTRHVRRSRSENHELAEERHLSLCLSPVHHSFNSPSHPNRSDETPPLMGTWFSPSQLSINRDLPLSCRTKGSPAQQQTRLSSSVVWDDWPLSESLTEFLCENHRDFNVGMEPQLNVQNQIEAISAKAKITTSISPDSARRTGQHSWILQDVTHRTINEVVGGNLNSACGDQEDKDVGDGESYDCSVDLFGGSLMRDTHAETPPKHSDTGPRKTCSLFFTPDKPELGKHTNGDSLIPPGAQELDFVPPSQSTPLVNTPKYRHNHGLTPKRRFKCQNSPLAQQHLWDLRGGFIHKRVSSVCGLLEESEALVPPTPASKVRRSEEKQRRNKEKDPSITALVSQQEDGQDCQSDLIASNSFLPNDTNQACDWSRDLFSDSQ